MQFLPREIKRKYKEKKAWNENVEISPYTVKYEGKLYYYIMFYPLFRSVSGAMVIEKNGNLPILDEAKPVIFQINGYNNMIGFANKHMKETLKRPVGMMRKIEEQINEVYPVIDSEITLYEEIKLLKVMAKTIYENHKELETIFKEIAQISKKVQVHNKVLDEDSFNRLFNLFTEWHVLLFKEKKMQLENFSDLPKIIENVKTQPNSAKLKKSLENLNTEKRKKVLEDFINGVLDHSVGNAMELSFTDEDLGEFRKLKNDEAYYMFEANLVPHIRN
ncbi:hypothetical protein ACQ0QQ_20465 [Lysinibacillus sphaericus]